MNPKEFDELTSQILLARLRELGFGFDRGCFFREAASQIRQVVLIDLDVRTGKAFRVAVGFNPAVISGDASPLEAGLFGVRYLGGKALSTRPVNFPCFSRSAAEGSIRGILDVIDNLVLPWFSSHATIEGVVDVIEDRYPFVKGKLLFRDGKFQLAKAYLEQHLNYLSGQRRLPEILRGEAETREMLHLCRG